MNKRNRMQLILEYLVDIFALTIASLSSLLICYKISKLPYIHDYAISAYLFISFISFSAVFLGFSSSINLAKRSRMMEALSVLRNTLLTFMTIAVMLILTKNPLMSSRYFFLISLILYFMLSSAGRYILKRFLIYKFSDSKMASLVCVVTVEDRAESFIKNLSYDWGRKIKGLALIDAVKVDNVYKYQQASAETAADGSVKIRHSEKLETVKEIAGVPVVANGDDFMDWIRSASIDEIFINTPIEIASTFEDYIEELESMGIIVHINIPIIENIVDSSNFDNLKCEMFAGYPMASFTAKEISTASLAFKRVTDIIISFFGCILSLPVILLTAIPLLIESKGPLIFKQPRVGKNGRIFNIYKLRSMYVDAEERKKELLDENEMDGLMFKISDDPRITKVGKFIRKTSIDELPQFWNVLKGDMSLIGTRPPTIDEFEKYESHHKRRLSMKPGISGMWQVSGRSDIQNFEEIVKLDCEYIDNWSPWLDMKILFKTIKVVLKRDGAE